MSKQVNNIEVENARIIFRNFSGRVDKFNTQGRKQFSLILDQGLAEELRDEGWNVKPLKSRDEDEEPKFILNVKVNYGSRVSPVIYLVSEGKKTLLNDKTVSILDNVDIENVDLVIVPYNYDANGKTGISAYVKNMYVTMQEDVFAKKYKEPEEDEELLPFA